MDIQTAAPIIGRNKFQKSHTLTVQLTFASGYDGTAVLLFAGAGSGTTALPANVTMAAASNHSTYAKLQEVALNVSAHVKKIVVETVDPDTVFAKNLQIFERAINAQNDSPEYIEFSDYKQSNGAGTAKEIHIPVDFNINPLLCASFVGVASTTVTFRFHIDAVSAGLPVFAI